MNIETLNEIPDFERGAYLKRVISLLLDLDVTEEAVETLAQPAWVMTRTKGAGSFAAYLEDVNLVWRKVEKENAPAPKTIGRLVQCALLEARTHTVTGSMSMPLICAGLELGFWGVDAALEYAGKAPYSEERIEAYIQIGTTLRKNRNQNAIVAFEKALLELYGQERNLNFLENFKKIIPLLPVDLFPSALYLAESIPYPDWKSQLMNTLIQHMPVEMMEKNLSLIERIGSDPGKANVLVALAPRISQHLLPEVLKLVARIKSGYSQSQVLIAISSYLPPVLVQDAVHLASKIPDPAYSTAALIPYVLKERPEAVPAMVRDILGDEKRKLRRTDKALVLSLIAPCLPADMRQEAFALGLTLEKFPDELLYHSVGVLEALAPYLPMDHQKRILADLKQWSMQDIAGYARILSAVAAHLEPGLLQELLADVRERIHVVYHGDPTLIEDAHSWSTAKLTAVLEALAPVLPPPLFRALLAVLDEVTDNAAKLAALMALSKYVPRELLPHAVQMAREVTGQYSESRVMALAALSTRGMPDVLEEALELAQQNPDSGWGGSKKPNEDRIALSVLLVQLSGVLPQDEQHAAVQMALEAARQLPYKQLRAQALIYMAQLLPSEQTGLLFKEAEETIHQIEDRYTQMIGMARLLRYCPPVSIPRVAKVVVDSFIQHFRSEPDVQITAKAMVLPGFADRLSPELLQETLLSAQHARNLELRGRAQALLAPHLPTDQRPLVLQDALQAAHQLEDMSSVEAADRFKITAMVAVQLPAEERGPVVAEALSLAQKSSAQGRVELAKVLGMIVPALKPDDYSQWFSLARELGCPEAFAAMAAEQPAGGRALYLQEALEAVEGIINETRRANILASLMPLFEPADVPAHLEAALESAIKVQSYEDRREVLQELAPAWGCLPQQEAFAIWKRFLRSSVSHDRHYLLANLAGTLPAVEAAGGVEALQAVFSVIVELCIRQPLGLPYQKTTQ